ncbi:hypothetical protein EPJ72_00905 [Brachyspira pilosicoli]|uniref:Uncharacterized protein n=1 Tax=Brachyspira pilosicoli TaxID=52584 RepID=A0A5C8FAP3_BRAPL|nr:hypothetical protein EPJ72_00905 [Brachyspira pilosicoli]
MIINIINYLLGLPKEMPK